MQALLFKTLLVTFAALILLTSTLFVVPQTRQALVLQFGEKNPGMTRVMVGDALVLEHERLTARMNQFFDRVESQLRQSLRLAAEAAGSPTPTVDAAALASAVVSLVAGRLQRYARSGFGRSPLEHLDVALVRLAG
jgi:TetR/AcrR family transcriptional regulator